MKEEYKEHYRQIREARERLKRSQKTRNITEALNDMDTSALMESFDHFLEGVKGKLAHVEARLDVAMENLLAEQKDILQETEQDEQLRRQKARDTLRQAKSEMGMLYNEIERQAGAMKVEKTVGKQKKPEQAEDSDTTKSQS